MDPISLYNFCIHSVPIRDPETQLFQPQGKISLFIQNLDTFSDVSGPFEIFAFWKLEFMTSVFLFFVQLIRGPKTYVLSLTSLVNGGTHLHFLYKESSFLLFPFLAHGCCGRVAPTKLGFSSSSCFFPLTHVNYYLNGENDSIFFFPTMRALYRYLLRRNPAILGLPFEQALSIWGSSK